MRTSDRRWGLVPRLVACVAVLAGCGGGGGTGADGGGDESPVAPTVTTLAAQMKSATEQTASGTVNPNGSETQFWFEWAADETFANAAATTPGTLAASRAAQPVSATIGGLTKAQHLHYRLVARNAAGTVPGAGRSCNHGANVVFATSATGTGNLGGWAEAGGSVGLAAGDAICQTLADAAEVPGTFKAWLSDQTTAARDRLAHSAEPYVRVDGVQVAASWSALMPAACVQGAPCVGAAISTDERGASVPGVMPTGSVYTETRWDGSSASAAFGTNACANWASGAAADLAGGGLVFATDYWWTESGIGACSLDRRLYCVQQRLDLPQEPFDTRCPGPLKGTWRVSACSNGLHQDAECAYVCCHFYKSCDPEVLPFTFGGYTVRRCEDDGSAYALSVGHAGHEFTVRCAAR